MSKTRQQISYNMSRVKSKDSEIEMILRKALWKQGIRYRKNVKTVPGHPDIAFIGKKVAVFVDGEFWHGYDWENRKNDFHSNQTFWISKIERNMQRDKDVNNQLISDGWVVLRFWGRQVRKDTQNCVEQIKKAVKRDEEN